MVRQATHHPRRLLHVTGDTSVPDNQAACCASSTQSARLTVLRAPLDGDGACFETFFDVCLIVFCALFAAVLALLAALLAAPFITVREPLLACTHAMAHRRDRSRPKSGEACAHHDLARQKLQLISFTTRSRTFSSRLGFLRVLPRKLFWSNMLAISTYDNAVGVDGQIQWAATLPYPCAS